MEFGDTVAGGKRRLAFQPGHQVCGVLPDVDDQWRRCPPAARSSAWRCPRRWHAAGPDPDHRWHKPASGTSCLFMTDSTARQLGYRLLVGSELEPLAATNNQESDAPYRVAEHQSLGGPW